LIDKGPRSRDRERIARWEKRGRRSSVESGKIRAKGKGPGDKERVIKELTPGKKGETRPIERKSHVHRSSTRTKRRSFNPKKAEETQRRRQEGRGGTKDTRKACQKKINVDRDKTVDRSKAQSAADLGRQYSTKTRESVGPYGRTNSKL